DEQCISQIKACANQVYEDWYDTPLKEAEALLTDANAIKQLPKGITQNYEGAIARLIPEKFLENYQKFARLDKRLLTTCLDWYNLWWRDVLNSKQENDPQQAWLLPASSK